MRIIVLGVGFTIAALLGAAIHRVHWSLTDRPDVSVIILDVDAIMERSLERTPNNETTLQRAGHVAFQVNEAIAQWQKQGTIVLRRSAVVAAPADLDFTQTMIDSIEAGRQ